MDIDLSPSPRPLPTEDPSYTPMPLPSEATFSSKEELYASIQATVPFGSGGLKLTIMALG
jgi:hypothetical protein